MLTDGFLIDVVQTDKPTLGSEFLRCGQADARGCPGNEYGIHLSGLLK
jgi:hypothetical protein